MSRGIVPKFCRAEPIAPLGWARVNKTTKEGLKTLVDPFGLPIGLGVVTCAHAQRDPGQPEKLLPKSAGEDPIAIRDNRIRQAVQLVYVIKKDPSNAGSCKGMRKSNEVAILCELVDDYKDTRVALRLGEPFDEIE